MQAIIYALGLERMLSPRREIPLPHALTDSIDVDGVSHRVLQSWVELEIENGRGDRLIARRFVKDTNRDTSLIETVSPAGAKDYFVWRAGSAIRDPGFHYELARFLGWQLPVVTRMDGSESLLYMECLFPFLFVEQKHGWSGIQARIPTYFGIRDVAKRSAEFLLSLDSYAKLQLKQRLEAAGNLMVEEWESIFGFASSTARSAGVVIRGIPPKPSERPDAVTGDVLVPHDGDWVPVEQELAAVNDRLAELAQLSVPTVGSVTNELESQLRGASSALAMSSARLRSAVQDHESTKSRLASVIERVGALKEDLQRHQDADLLRQIGSRHSSLMSADSHCPTCQQELVDGFDITNSPMTPSESISYIRQELKTFSIMSDDLADVLAASQVKIDQLRVECASWRTQIRSLEDSLTSPSAMPSVASVAERLKLADRLSVLRSVRDEVSRSVEDLRTRIEPWSENRKRLRSLSRNDESESDVEKLVYMQRSLVAQLRSYQFTSLTPESIEVSHDTYRPIHEGFDLGFDLSASDMIRVIWAYLLALLETGIAHNTNHPRILLLDEPRQQETNRVSFAALLERAAQNRDDSSQIIFATSEEESSLVEIIGSLPRRLVSHPSGLKLLRPIGT